MLSPRKQVPLASGSPGDRPRAKSLISSDAIPPTKRAFFCSVVFELGYRGHSLPQDVQDLIASLGTQLTADGKPVVYDDDDLFAAEAPSDAEALLTPALTDRRKSGPPKPSTLANLVHELVKTERGYVQRIKILKESYADPLRRFARSKDTAIIPAYQAKTLFANIDALVPVHEAFLDDLERMVGPNGPRTVGGLGDVAKKHFVTLKAFDCYKQWYAKREEAQSIFKEETRKAPFSNFIERIQYSTHDAKNRVGLSELLIDPVQRIPRYTMMFESILKCMSSSDPQRAMLMEAKDAATKIAQAENDQEIIRAAIIMGLQRSISGFPPGLISNNRRFIDCLDVEDTGADASGAPSSNPSVPCTLFLFDDRLVIVKRNGTSTSGRKLAGLDNMEKLTKGGFPGSAVKKMMSCKGVVDLIDVVAADPGGTDLHLFLEREPTDQSERWSNRPFRSLSVVHPPANAAQAPVEAANDKKRFLDNLWLAQALYRSKSGRSIPFASGEMDVGSSRRTTIARTYFNVYQRTAYLSEPSKGKIVLHIDPTGMADPIPFGVESGPYVVVRVRPRSDGLSVYSVSSCDASDEGDEDMIPSSNVASHIAQTIHQCGLFRFQAGKNSRPTTPTASTRGRGAIFNLDNISRNLFNSSRSATSSRGISGGDMFGSLGSGSGSGKKQRSRSNSRASTLVTHSTGTTTTHTNDSSTRFFASQRSVSTAATSVMEAGDSFGHKSRSSSSPRKLLGSLSRSPSKSCDSADFAAMSYDSLSRSAPSAQSFLAADVVMNDESLDNVELNLALARHNSRTLQHNIETEALKRGRTASTVEDTIPEDSEDSSTIRHAPSILERPPSPSASSSSHLMRPQSPLPSRPSSAMSIRRPMGPRDLERAATVSATDIEHALKRASSQMSQSQPRTPSPSRGHRKRVPLEPDLSIINGSPITPVTPEPPQVDNRPPVEPLSIVKKTSVRVSGIPQRKDGNLTRTATLPRREDENVPVASTSKSHNLALGKNFAGRASSLADQTWEDIERSQRSVKRIRLEVDDISTARRDGGASSSTKRPHSRNMSAADARMEEMRMLIEKGRGNPPRSGSPSPFNPSPDALYDHLKSLVVEAERDLKKVTGSHQALQTELRLVSAEALDKDAELVRTTNELQNTKRQCDLVKKLLSDATAENEIMYDAFNEELDGMFQDANLPETEAWNAMVEDLRKTKDERNTLTKENRILQRNLEQAQLQCEQWGALLRSHGLMP